MGTFSITATGLVLRQMAVVGKHADGTTGAGQRSLHRLGFHEIPIINVANACATGSNAIYLARQMIQASTSSHLVSLHTLCSRSEGC